MKHYVAPPSCAALLKNDRCVNMFHKPVLMPVCLLGCVIVFNAWNDSMGHAVLQVPSFEFNIRTRSIDLHASRHHLRRIIHVNL